MLSFQDKVNDKSQKNANLQDVSIAKLQKRGFVVIDDDPAFCKVLQATAQKRFGIPCDAYHSLEDIIYFARLQEYDLIILDFHLTVLNGAEIAHYVDTFFKDLPVVLISADEDKLLEVTDKLGSCVKGVMSKSEGVIGILNKAIAVYNRETELNSRK